MLLPGFLAVLIFVASGTIAARDMQDTRGENFRKRHQAGVRLGVWGNLGDTPLEEISDNSSSIVFINDFKDASFYIEGFAAYRFSPCFMGELSLGVVSRGEVTRRDPSSSLYGSLLVYPMLLKLKLYPLEQWSFKFHPYLTVGGGIYHARHDIQIASGAYYYSTFYEEESKTSLNYVLGGGFDWPVATTIGLEFSAQYMPINFSKALIGVTDWSSLTITIGAKYLFESKKKK